MESDFRDLWNASNGDLIYGNSPTRTKYFLGAGMQVPKGGFAFMDDFNNAFFCPVLSKMNPFKKQETIDELTEDVERGARGGYGDYVAGIWDHKYSPKRAVNMNQVNVLEKEGYMSLVQEAQRLIRSGQGDEAQHRSLIRVAVRKAYENKAIRRGCKYGLLMVIHGLNESFPKARIHFALDGLRLGSIARRETYASDFHGRQFQRFSITGSELRSLCRQWPTIKLRTEKMSRLVFYVNGGVVGPPWIDSWNTTDIFGKASVNDHHDWLPYLEKYQAPERDEAMLRALLHVEPPPVPNREGRSPPPALPQTHAQRFQRIRDRFESGKAYR